MATPADDNRLGRAYGAPEVTVFYDRGRCRHYAECVRGLPQVFDPTRRPWIRAELADAQAVAEVVRRCPTGALHYRLLAAEPEAPTRPTIITRDPAGPLLVRGDLVLDTPEGRFPRPEPRCVPAAAPRISPSVTAPAASTPAPPAAPGTRGQQTARSLEPGAAGQLTMRLGWSLRAPGRLGTRAEHRGRRRCGGAGEPSRRGGRQNSYLRPCSSGCWVKSHRLAVRAVSARMGVRQAS
jgi:uncharacterized Fe-S cluster protein YjdI